MIRVKSLSKDYGLRRAVSEITFNAEKGEILGFLGPNGAGKTTTMRMLTGYMPPLAEQLKLAGMTFWKIRLKFADWWATCRNLFLI